MTRADSVARRRPLRASRTTAATCCRTSRHRSLAAIFLRQFKGPFMYVLVAAALVSAALGRWSDASDLPGVDLARRAVAFHERVRAHQAAHRLGRALGGMLLIASSPRRY